MRPWLSGVVDLVGARPATAGMDYAVAILDDRPRNREATIQRTRYGVAMTSLPLFEFSFPGPLREKLIAAVLDGSKSSTTSLLKGYEHEGTAPRQVGTRSVVIDSEERPVVIIETTNVRVVPVAQVDLEHVVAEGEGLTTVAEWRTEHELGWHSVQQREEFGDPEFAVSDETMVVLERFRVVEDLRTAR
jgi:uncharacterized protein YhfF